jgi:hypothetical protein
VISLNGPRSKFSCIIAIFSVAIDDSLMPLSMGSHLFFHSIVVRLTAILRTEIRRIDHQLHEDLLNRVDIYLPNVSLNVLILLAWSSLRSKD